MISGTPPPAGLIDYPSAFVLLHAGDYAVLIVWSPPWYIGHIRNLPFYIHITGLTHAAVVIYGLHCIHVIRG